MGKIIGIFDENKQRRFDFLSEVYKKSNFNKYIFTKTKMDLVYFKEEDLSEEETLELMFFNIRYIHFGISLFCIDETVYYDKLLYMLKLLKNKNVLVYVVFKQFSKELVDIIDMVYLGDVNNKNILNSILDSGIQVHKISD